MLGLWLAAAAAASPLPVDSAPLRFCLAAHNLPFSTSHPPWGIDGELAKAIGRKLDRQVEFVWISDEEETPEEALRDRRCDAAMGAIVEADGLARPSGVPGLALSKPYYTAGYMLVHRPSAPSPNGLDEVSAGRIAVEMVSIPIYTLKQRGKKVYAVDDMEAVVDAVADGRAEYGYVWGPVGAWLLRERKDVVLARDFDPDERWSFSVAIREADRRLLESLNEALADLVSSGEVQRTFARYFVPYLPPPASATALTAR